ncbi:MAG: hypothetical protein ACXWN2_08875, partial [Candidatus Limnocylindrales bacterium]
MHRIWFYRKPAHYARGVTRGAGRAGAAEVSDLCFFVRSSDRPQGRAMIIVMSAAATAEEINSVKSAILAEGLQPHENPGQERVMIALVGDVGPRQQ